MIPALRGLTAFIAAFSGLMTSAFADGDKSPSEEKALRLYEENCAACHLRTGHGILAMNCPSIAGLPRWYVSKQLRDFQNGRRGAHAEDQSGKLMTAIALSLSQEKIAFVGKHVESLARNEDRRTSGDFDIEKGKHVYKERCAACHGEAAEGNQKLRTPPLNVQPDWYVLRQIRNFAKGIRSHATTKDSVAIDLDDQMEEVAAYLASIEVKR